MCVKIVGALREGYEVYVYVSAYMGVYASVQTVGTWGTRYIMDTLPGEWFLYYGIFFQQVMNEVVSQSQTLTQGG